MTRATTTMWHWSRVTSLIAAAIAGPLMYVSMHLEFENQTPSWPFICALLGFGIAGVWFVLGLQIVNPWVAAKWSKPSWRASPLDMRQPIQMFHLGAWCLIIAGMTAALYTLLLGARNFMFVLPLTFGIGALLGVKLAVLSFRRKFEEGGNAA